MTTLTCAQCGRAGKTRQGIPSEAQDQCPGCSASLKPSSPEPQFSEDEREPGFQSCPAQPGDLETGLDSFAVSPPPPPVVQRESVPVAAFATQPCSYCGKEIISIAIKCKHCGQFLDSDLGAPVIPAPDHRRKWSPGVAAVLSSLVPGLGQIYKGNLLRGLAWLVICLVGYLCLIVPGLILHGICICMAASGDPNRR